jgi:D-glutamate cyclase
LSPHRELLAIVQADPGHRGLASWARANLDSGALGRACRALAQAPPAGALIFTGFHIPAAAAPETDGPPGALFLAEVLGRLGFRVALAAEGDCLPALAAGLAFLGLGDVPLLETPPGELDPEAFLAQAEARIGACTHLLAVEKAGPSHTPESLRAQEGFRETDLPRFLQEVPPGARGRVHTMFGRDITALTAPVARLFDPAFCRRHGLTRLGIGDGGNEIGMGRIPWRELATLVPGPIACATSVDHLLVAGVSNWGAYALGLGTLALRNLEGGLDPAREKALLDLLVARGGLVDGRLGLRQATVDGLSWEVHASVIQDLRSCLCVP